MWRLSKVRLLDPPSPSVQTIEGRMREREGREKEKEREGEEKHESLQSGMGCGGEDQGKLRITGPELRTGPSFWDAERGLVLRRAGAAASLSAFSQSQGLFLAYVWESEPKEVNKLGFKLREELVRQITVRHSVLIAHIDL